MTLLEAVEQGDLAAVCASLREPGVDVNVRDEHGRTPLLLAVLSGYVSIVETLLASKQADLNAVGKDCDYNALHFAVEGGYVEIARLLCAEGADVYAAPPEGQSALLMAAGKDDSSVFEVLYPHTEDSVQCDHANLIASALTVLRFADPLGWEEVDAVETVFADEGENVTRTEVVAFVDACDEDERAAFIKLFARVNTMIQLHNKELEEASTWAWLWSDGTWEATVLQSAHAHYAKQEPVAAAGVATGPK